MVFGSIMAQKDYIKRGNPKSNKRKPLPEKPPTPLIPLIFVTLIVAGFGYFLWSINGAADNPAQSPVAATVATKPSNQQNSTKTVAKTVTKTAARATKKAADIPPAPEKEDWQYIEALKRKTVDVAVIKTDKKGPFLMQCATFKNARRAEAFKAQLALLNFESRIKVSSGTNGTFHRVQLGPYKTNRDALRARHKLNKHKINGCKIWLWS